MSKLQGAGQLMLRVWAYSGPELSGRAGRMLGSRSVGGASEADGSRKPNASFASRGPGSQTLDGLNPAPFLRYSEAAQY